jgi:hypothetical protein
LSGTGTGKDLQCHTALSYANVNFSYIGCPESIALDFYSTVLFTVGTVLFIVSTVLFTVSTTKLGIYLHKNQQMHKNYHFIIMLGQTLGRVPQQSTSSSNSVKLLIGTTSLDIPLFFCNVHRQVACEDRVSSLIMALVHRNM